MLNLSPKNNGSQHLVACTEVLAPGATLPKHRHLLQDEILLLQNGTAHVSLGEAERDLHAGGLVFIPANTWIIRRPDFTLSVPGVLGTEFQPWLGLLTAA